jgi:BirA family transcriptional regulator, biotin operon repressor / biotin---[acetyl-CoA-carboxylase] ligase
MKSDEMNISRVRSQLPGHRIHWHRTIGSTMTEASRLAAEGCPSLTIVGADEQTAGQGRYGRAWHSESGSGLYVSIVLRHSLSSSSLPVVTLALALATVEAILKAAGVACDIRWPNDILIHSKKCGGILAQLEGGAIIAGIGINLNQAEFPPELESIATSLSIASGRVHSREQLLVDLALSVDAFCGALEREGPEPILKMFSRASSFVHGRRVSVDLGNSTLYGTTAGLNSSGFLILRGDDGRENVVMAGGVRPCS